MRPWLVKCPWLHTDCGVEETQTVMARLSAGWASPCTRGLWGGDALLLSTGAAGNRAHRRRAAGAHL
jgi:hypothetical protein